MSKYDWSNVPKEVEWIATDAIYSGAWVTLENQYLCQLMALGQQKEQTTNQLEWLLRDMLGTGEIHQRSAQNDNIPRFNTCCDFHIIVCCFSYGVRFG